MADADGNSYGPYDIEVPDSEAEAFTEAAWYRLDQSNYVVSGGGLTFSGLTATLAPLLVRVHGSWLEREAPWTDASPPTTGASPRRDLLVARRQRTVGTAEDGVPGKTYLTVLRGTPAAIPDNPDHDPANDLLLYDWQVPGGGGTVVTDVHDLRGGRNFVASRTGLNVPQNTDTTRAKFTGQTVIASSDDCHLDVDGSLVIDSGGWWALTATISSDIPAPGLSEVRLVHPTSGMPDGVLTQDQRHRSSSGYPGSGTLRQPLHWSGYLAPGAALFVDVLQRNTNNAAISNYALQLSAAYRKLGAS